MSYIQNTSGVYDVVQHCVLKFGEGKEYLLHEVTLRVVRFLETAQTIMTEVARSIRALMYCYLVMWDH